MIELHVCGIVIFSRIDWSREHLNRHHQLVKALILLLLTGCINHNSLRRELFMEAEHGSHHPCLANIDIPLLTGLYYLLMLPLILLRNSELPFTQIWGPETYSRASEGIYDWHHFSSRWYQVYVHVSTEVYGGSQGIHFSKVSYISHT